MAVWRGVQIGWEHGPAFATAITDEETQRLRELAQGKRVLEVGAAYGYSAAVMSNAGAISVTSVDPHTFLPSMGVMTANLESLKSWGYVGLVTMVPEFSATALPRMANEEGRKFGFIFIDGDHTAPHVAEDALLSIPLLEDGGTLAFHDYGDPECPDVKPVLDNIFPEGPDRLTGCLWEKTFTSEDLRRA